MKTIKFILFIALMLLIAGVTAETVTGSLGSINYYQNVYNNTHVITTNYPFTNVAVHNVEYAQGTTALIIFDSSTYYISVDAGAPAGVVVPCNLTYGSQLVVTGSFGYQRSYNSIYQEIAGYQYIQFNNDWNLTGLTGDKMLTLNYNHNDMYNISKHVGTGFTGTFPTTNYPVASGDMYIEGNSGSYGGSMYGQYWRTINFNVGADYTAEKPSGLGISGNITKTTGMSQAYVFDNYGAVISSEYSLSANTFNFTTSKEQIMIGILSSSGVFFNSSLLFDAGLVTPTPTPLVSDYTITVTPQYSSYNQPLTATLKKGGSTSITNANVFSIEWAYLTTQNGLPSMVPLYESGSTTKRLDYIWKNDTSKWYGWDEITQDWTNDKGGTFPNPVILTPTKTGDVTIRATVGTSINELYQPETTVNIAGTADLKTIGVYVVDWLQGGYLAGATVSIKDLAYNNWTNKTASNTGYAFFSYPSGSKLYIAASAPYYVESGKNYEVYKDDYVTITIYPTGTGSTNVSESLVLVKTYEDNGESVRDLAGVSLTLSDGQVGTSASGAASFTVLNNTMLTVTGYRAGYLSSTKTVYVNTAVVPISLYLISTSSTLIPTPFPTITTTPIPSPTPYGNVTTCRAVLPANSTVVAIMKNNIACWGVEDLESQNYTFALGLILVCALILGKIAKGQGAAIGAIIGFVGSYAMHFIPFWLVALALILVGAYFAKVLFGSK